MNEYPIEMDGDRWYPCPQCDGEPFKEVADPRRDDPYYARVAICSNCCGTGWECESGWEREAVPKAETRPARLFIEAFCGINDVFPGDPYPVTSRQRGTP